jgi:hypothetical protein
MDQRSCRQEDVDPAQARGRAGAPRACLPGVLYAYPRAAGPVEGRHGPLLPCVPAARGRGQPGREQPKRIDQERPGSAALTELSGTRALWRG